MDEKLKNEWLNALVKLYEKQLMLDKSIMKGSKKERVESYIDVLEQARQEVMNSGNKDLEKVFKDFYHDLYVIKEKDIPYSVYEAEQRNARELGYGKISITDEYIKEKNEQIIEDQIISLDRWLDYFLYDEEAKIYKPWEVYWVLEGLQKLGKYDKQTGIFTKRDKKTIYPFPDVDKAAIFTTLNLMEQYLKSKNGPDELKGALGQSNFKQLYEYSLKKIYLNKQEKSKETRGVWIKYDCGSDYHIMKNDLEGKMTGWCIEAGDSFAKDYLSVGDFYIYYTIDEEGNYTNPRIAIRTEDNEIKEIRGILENQNIEPEMLPILDEKLNEFPDKARYQRKAHDMEYLTQIEKKVNSGVALDMDELNFLYEIDYEIKGFGWEKDPRVEELKLKKKEQEMERLGRIEKKSNSNIELNIKELVYLYEIRNKINCLDEEVISKLKEIKSKRNQKKDLSIIYNYPESAIATKNSEVNKDTKLFFGDIKLSMQTSENLRFPALVKGSICLNKLEFVENIIFPQAIYGNIELPKLASAHRLRFPKNVNGDIDLGHLFNVDILELPEFISGQVSLEKLKIIEKLVLPKSMNSDLKLTSLNSAVGLVFPDELTYKIYLANDIVITPENVDEFKNHKNYK